MKNAEMKVIKFDGNDVIATSGFLATFNSNNTVTYKGTSYNYNSRTSFYDAINNDIYSSTGGSYGYSDTWNNDHADNRTGIVDGYDKISNGSTLDSYWSKSNLSPVAGSYTWNGDNWSKQ